MMYYKSMINIEEENAEYYENREQGEWAMFYKRYWHLSNLFSGTRFRKGPNH